MLPQRSDKRLQHKARIAQTVLRALALATACSLPVTGLAQDSSRETYGAAHLWASEVRDFATQSLSTDEGVGVAAVPLDGPGIDQYVNADQLMSPGSIMKLVTTYAALELLGPNHRWETDFLTDGNLVGNTLEGNLYVRFSGDPKLTIERLWRTLRELRSMGVTRINGDLVLDGTHFQVDGFPKFDDTGDNPYRPFLVEPSAYLTNLNLLHFQVRADERGTQAWATPNLSEVTIDNRITATAEGPCPARRRFDWTPIFHDDNKVTVQVTGSLPQGCRTTTYLSLLPHEQYSASLIRSVLAETGVTVNGGDRLAKTPEDARLMMRTSSPDLVTMVRDINKWSSNVMARQMLLAIGAEHRQEDQKDDRVAGIEAIYGWLEGKGINTAGMVIDNGSGLTRHGRITARQGVKILQQAWQSPYASDLMASLPIIAMDGTMASRLKNTGLDGKGRIKTGLLANVRSIAGFTRDENNTTWAIVGMVNNDPAWNGKAVLDQVLHSLHYQPPTGTAVSQSDTAAGRRTTIQ
ncbi:D-alanyl-D-alanine carboxypeptidase / D-alanyl-D-alanine-endopeptidase (penicillin-binding protein 4) [Marinobacter persicus]|uniref:D-alanyl-D-alanine carboxypeptidase / D-alanyl-D-alanine-endopeptidase (Penicillin-binding protein 4) n=1 Tax=Marinobacter persicus TaxID=930118 RepID=A0A1I3UC85_9GAMM|nr:D-alanyl-D-alanine carboxypeptidase/D-alanyl-D-alanine-endopeptidase [Marinobacter persicus]GHD54276.1 D-alanyl-D-alanine carboxypeptidase [Marinobacter persicus]SFJ79397.1 D-alanyl-D-alanine carboxypeptidase / D-alanyl-D-alanine-endopeptidase (penicillin-binding protein 4) [Marinobacter persicus]